MDLFNQADYFQEAHVYECFYYLHEGISIRLSFSNRLDPLRENE